MKTARLTLSPPTEADAAFVLELLNDPGWIANIGDRGVRDLEGARAYIVERFSKSPWFVIRDPSGAPIGMAGIVVGREGLDTPDIGYALLARHAGHGYATEAAAAVLAHARSEMGLSKVAAITTPTNTASQRVLEKLGLRFVQMINLPGHDEASAYYST
ncbi:GNAT family N-acetyltransferase [Phenylobacterium sp. J367]|uniref:GNAT family N-acetyltransferase n=1 Tax=Phenylobacterium sp. J367 TaxID=2898435 RepID=UPI002151BBFF|nr:GNAT family N-acetyltransferase [Phenylobacterium sp. J367]MCR5880325.1 GNAT family N-acetyltransferase [Phenylobacterium sp. J367]